VFVGPNNAAKSTLLEALDLVLHPGLGRPRPSPDELDYFARDPGAGFEIELVIGALSEPFLGEVRDHLEGWDAGTRVLVAEPDGEKCEAVVRVRASATPDFDLVHEFAKPESQGARFGPRIRRHLGWLFDGRTRDPAWQMVFHRGGVLDRMFDDADLGPALERVREGLRSGAEGFSGDAAVLAVIADLAGDLNALEVMDVRGFPEFELGGVSDRELLQTLRLALPALPQVTVPLRQHGRGVQRLLLVSALLRLARQEGAPAPIAAFEEPEEALEPLRQSQIARMITEVADDGGQVFVVTHSTDIARAFAVDDLHLVSSHPERGATISLRDRLDARAKQGYERRLDGPVVQAMLVRIPVLVEGPSDRAFLAVVWDHLADTGAVKARYARSLDFINCEGASHQSEMARLLRGAGKAVVGWAEHDVPDDLARLRDGKHCALLVVYPDDPARHNLEALISSACSLDVLAEGMKVVAETRGYSWEEQRKDLLSRCNAPLTDEQRADMKGAEALRTLLGALPEEVSRSLVRGALAPDALNPFEMKGARPARLFAEVMVSHGDVPQPLVAAMSRLDEWIDRDCPPADVEFDLE
jgi:putative ATP-dependent endonuclease of OLD family